MLDAAGRCNLCLGICRVREPEANSKWSGALRDASVEFGLPDSLPFSIQTLDFDHTYHTVSSLSSTLLNP